MNFSAMMSLDAAQRLQHTELALAVAGMTIGSSWKIDPTTTGIFVGLVRTQTDEICGLFFLQSVWGLSKLACINQETMQGFLTQQPNNRTKTTGDKT